MAKKRGKAAGAKAAATAGVLGFGLGEDDRATPKGRGRPVKLKAPPPKPRKAAKGKTAKRGGRATKGRRGPFALLARGIRGLVHWAAVFLIIGATGVVGLVGYYWAKLPPTSEWALPARPANVRILSADGQLITNRGDSTGQSLTLDEMPPYLPEAVIAIEDRRFYAHFGIDPVGLVRAFATNLKAGGVVQGGSTLTQQLAKNLFLKPERTFERKVQEVILAVWLEASLSKREILELYLNRVYLGAGAYGVDAAAHRYFGKSARDVTLAEAATLAALLKAPGRYSPLLDRDAAEGRAQLVLAAMREQGYITDSEAAVALSEEVRPVRDVAGGSGRYVADWVMDILPSYVGAIDEDIIVDTTIDLRLQALAARSLAETLTADNGVHGVSQGAFVAMDPSGAVKALVGGRDYATSPYNRAVAAKRQPGSAFKPFVYLTALEAGLAPETVRVDRPIRIGNWSPENYTRKYLGPVTLQSALALSLNTVSAELVAEVGPAAVAATARRLGIKSPLQPIPSIALGTSEVSLLELTGAFAPFANGGAGVIPHVVTRIRTAAGKVLYERTGSGPGIVVDPLRVGMMNTMLRATLEQGTGKSAALPGWPAAGKTGTSQDFRDAWFVGYTARLVAGVWYGNDDNRPTKKAAGSNLPAAAWHRFMVGALYGAPVAELPGDYRFRDPANDPAGPPQSIVPVATYGEDGRPIPAAPAPLDPETTGAVSGPVPPGMIGAPPQRKGFFRRLFGG
ncbi:MAG TPA: PBP1A family penicillin-binding protein [Bauldia sp.]|nr:PBP1A family penicillin-binding protein [Bauldia sp.]